MTEGSTKKGILRFIEAAAQPALPFYLLPALMVLLVAGTVAQRYVGLYDAQKMFFGSFIAWLGPVPLPGGYTLIALIAASLLLKFLFFSVWKREKAGINLAHLGVLVMLIGGLITALQSREGFMVISEGESTDIVSDYHQRELLVLKNDAVFARFPHEDVRAGKTLVAEGLPFGIRVREACRNCGIIKREDAARKYEALRLHGMANGMALIAQKPAAEDETNLAGATIEIFNAGKESNGVYVVFEAMPKPVEVPHGEDAYGIIYQKAQRILPFAIRLDNFSKSVHPGTQTARAYSSDIAILEGKIAWPVTIGMNKPLRYKGYTFFQSSFIEDDSGLVAASVLTVVRNTGWLFPYIGALILAAGLLLHCLLMRRAGKGAA